MNDMKLDEYVGRVVRWGPSVFLPDRVGRVLGVQWERSIDGAARLRIEGVKGQVWIWDAAFLVERGVWDDAADVELFSDEDGRVRRHLEVHLVSLLADGGVYNAGELVDSLGGLGMPREFVVWTVRGILGEMEGREFDGRMLMVADGMWCLSDDGGCDVAAGKSAEFVPVAGGMGEGSFEDVEEVERRAWRAAGERFYGCLARQMPHGCQAWEEIDDGLRMMYMRAAGEFAGKR